MSELDDVATRLRRFAESQLPGVDDLQIDDLRRTSAGFSRENWVFDASWTGGDGVAVHEPLIMRRDPVGSVLDTDRRQEFAVLQALEGTAVPAPRVRWLDPDGDALGRPSVVMVREEGNCDWFVLSGDRSLDDRVAIAHRFLDLLATILCRWSRNMPRPATSWPNLKRYVDRIRQRPALREVHAREGLTDWIDG